MEAYVIIRPEGALGPVPTSSGLRTAIDRR